MTTYRLLTGMNYLPRGIGPEEVRRESGEVVSDLPPVAIRWLTEQGAIDLVSEDTPEVHDRRGA